MWLRLRMFQSALRTKLASRDQAALNLATYAGATCAGTAVFSFTSVQNEPASPLPALGENKFTAHCCLLLWSDTKRRNGTSCGQHSPDTVDGWACCKHCPLLTLLHCSAAGSKCLRPLCRAGRGHQEARAAGHDAGAERRLRRVAG